MIAIFLFYEGKFWKFSACSLILVTPDGAFMFEPYRSHIGFRKLKTMDIESYISKIKRYSKASELVVLEIKSEPRQRISSILSKTCNELLKHIAGLDLGFTFTPYQFYKQILKYNKKRNYEILQR